MSDSNDFEIENHTFGEYVQYCLKKFPNCWIAQPQIDKIVTFQTLYEMSKSIEEKIGDHEFLSNNDVVHFIGVNSVALISVFNAITFKGWIPVGSNSTTPAHELMSNIKATHSRALFVEKSIWEKLDGNFESDELCIIFVYELVDSESLVVTLDRIELKEHAERNYDQDELTDVSYMFLTSGSTGLPKAVMIDYKSTRKGFEILQNSVGKSKNAENPTFVTVNCQPFPNSGGFLAYFSSLGGRGNYVIIEGFDPEYFLQSFVKYRANYLGGTAAIISSLAKYEHLEQFDFSNIFLLGCGGAKIDPNMIKLLKERTQISDKALFAEIYGSSEAMFSHMKSNPITSISLSLGQSLPPIECKILDVNSGGECESNSEGEICIKTPAIMKGYFCDKEKTRSVLFDGGWYRTGDLGKKDANGNLYITGRLKDVIKYRSFSVYAAELEVILNSSSSVKAAAVLAKPHAEHGEIPVAFIVASANIEEGVLLKYVADRVSEYKRIHEVHFINEMPFNNGLKIDKQKLKKLL